MNMESKSSFRLNPKNLYVEVDSSDSNLFNLKILLNETENR
jgi:hypothetical protein